MKPFLIPLAILVVGCGAPPPAGTGAKESAQGFYEALVAKDWPRAYSAVAAESKAGLSVEQFAKLGEAYRRGVGFDPQTVRLTACDENGAGAVAHVTLTGPGAGRHRYKDAITLRRDDDRWVVVLPSGFGKRANS